jgi:hypothetical protein
MTLAGWAGKLDWLQAANESCNGLVFRQAVHFCFPSHRLGLMVAGKRSKRVCDDSTWPSFNHGLHHLVFISSHSLSLPYNILLHHTIPYHNSSSPSVTIFVFARARSSNDAAPLRIKTVHGDRSSASRGGLDRYLHINSILVWFRDKHHHTHGSHAIPPAYTPRARHVDDIRSGRPSQHSQPSSPLVARYNSFCLKPLALRTPRIST